MIFYEDKDINALKGLSSCFELDKSVLGSEMVVRFLKVSAVPLLLLLHRGVMPFLLNV